MYLGLCIGLGVGGEVLLLEPKLLLGTSRNGYPLSLPLQPHFHFIESLAYNIVAQGHLFYVSHRMSKTRRILSSSSFGVLKPCSLCP